ncbi:MAG: DUF3516 domain-containing protein, partial [Acidobacteriota bacterium]|nr:DUF3516 domain-containing protein [Acidobacteriota bacterium]
MLKAWSRGDGQAALEVMELPDPSGPEPEPWTPERLAATFEGYLADHQGLRFDPEARNTRHTYVSADSGLPVWRVQQVLVDPDMHNDWVAEFDVDVRASRARQQPVLRLHRIGPVA